MKDYKKEIRESNIFYSAKTNYKQCWSQEWTPKKCKRILLNYNYVLVIIEMTVVIRQTLNYGER